MWILVVVLGGVFLLLFAETLHCKVLDWRERREVANVWEGCIAVARVSLPNWASERAQQHEAEQLFAASNARRVEKGLGRRPSHLIGTPAAELIRRYA